MPSVRWHELLFKSSFIYFIFFKKSILYLARMHYDAIDQKVTVNFYDVPKKIYFQ